MYHRVQRLEVQPFVAWDLFQVVFLGYRGVAPPLIRCDLGILGYVQGEHSLELLCREVLYPVGVHAPYLAVLGKLHGARDLFLLAVIAAPHLADLPAAHNELVHVDDAVHGVVATGGHGLPYLVHEEPRGLFGHTVANAHVTGRQALGGGRHLKANVEGLANPEPYPVEEGCPPSPIRCGYRCCMSVNGPP